MITFEQAKQKAKEIIPKADVYYDYPDAFIFSNSTAKGPEQVDNEVVILKPDGKIVDYSIYIMNTKYWDKEVQAKLVI